MITGGSGFLGYHIIQALQRSGVVNVTCGDIEKNSNLSCNFVKLNLFDAAEVRHVIKGYETVINCIGQVTKPFNLSYRLNSSGVNNLIQALSGQDSRLIHISTVAVYGTAENCNEDSPLNPETNYATAKAFAEYSILKQIELKRFTILRLSNLYGAHQLKGIFAYLLRSYHSDCKLDFNNDGNLIRSFMHVEDCADIIVEVVKDLTLKGIYNVKGHETYSVKELIQKFEDRFNMTFEKKFDHTPPWENIRVLDDSKLRSTVNLNPRWQLFDFIEQEINKHAHA